MVDIPINPAPVGVPELRAFLQGIPAELEQIRHWSRSRWASKAERLRVEAYRDRVRPALEDIIEALNSPSGELDRALDERGLTGWNLEFKLHIATRTRERVASRTWFRRIPFLQGFYGRAAREYLAVLEVLFSSIADAFKAAGYDLAAGGEAIKEFLGFVRWLFELLRGG